MTDNLVSIVGRHGVKSYGHIIRKPNLEFLWRYFNEISQNSFFKLSWRISWINYWRTFLNEILELGEFLEAFLRFFQFLIKFLGKWLEKFPRMYENEILEESLEKFLRNIFEKDLEEMPRNSCDNSWWRVRMFSEKTSLINTLKIEEFFGKSNHTFSGNFLDVFLRNILREIPEKLRGKS